ncbi:ORF439 [White spot syndrome virus]|uniref:ORF439 n=1 Tax=White spot syndrome virus TaxID=342409 RepID=A0A2D3I6E8_9VIRU|nr:ORF439 [White spot syndrome virus]
MVLFLYLSSSSLSLAVSSSSSVSLSVSESLSFFGPIHTFMTARTRIPIEIATIKKRPMRAIDMEPSRSSMV